MARYYCSVEVNSTEEDRLFFEEMDRILLLQDQKVSEPEHLPEPVPEPAPEPNEIDEGYCPLIPKIILPFIDPDDCFAFLDEEEEEEELKNIKPIEIFEHPDFFPQDQEFYDPTQWHYYDEDIFPLDLIPFGSPILSINVDPFLPVTYLDFFHPFFYLKFVMINPIYPFSYFQYN